MFDIELNAHQKVALIRFKGDVTEADFAALDALGAANRNRGPFDVILDFTNVQRSSNGAPIDAVGLPSAPRNAARQSGPR